MQGSGTPQAFADGFAESLESKAQILSALGRQTDAQAARDEASAIRSDSA
jgi:hypothetical protein